MDAQNEEERDLLHDKLLSTEKIIELSNMYGNCQLMINQLRICKYLNVKDRIGCSSLRGGGVN